MAFDFTEDLTIQLPDVEQQISAFEESGYRKDHGLIIEVAAIHEGLTANYNMYTAKALEESLSSWVSPYPKPIIINHDLSTEPLGRVMAAKMEQEDDGTPYVLLQIAVTDPEAMAKVSDQRYLTGSVGGKAESATCSICEADWSNASITNIPCRHSRGKTYKGKLAYLEIGGISFREYSFVNVPADQQSSVRKVSSELTEDKPKESANDDGWVRAAKVYSLNMNEQEVLELSDRENTDVLESLQSREASPVYMQIKGAFLSALAASVSEASDNEEQEVTNKTTEDEDILAVAEELSSDLAEKNSVEEEKVEENDEAPTDSDDTGAEDGDDDGSSDSEDTSTEEEAPSASEADEDGDDDEDDSDEEEEPVAAAAESTDETEEEEESDKDDTPEGQEDEDDEEEKDGSPEESDSATDLSEDVTALESRVTELEAKRDELLEENGKLRKLLKQNLAERVVDMKIATGIANESDRASLLEDHVGRTASSLADTLRDLSKMPARQVTESPADAPTVEEKSSVTDKGEPVVNEGDDDEDSFTEINPQERYVKKMSDVLMGRLPLQ